MTPANQAALSGFEVPVYDSTYVFRALLDAISRPGKIHSLEQSHDVPLGFNRSATALILTLADMDTPVWLTPEIDTPEARDFITFHTGSRVLESPKLADFVIASTQTDTAYRSFLRTGTPECPDQSATLVLMVPSLDQGPEVTLSGPGLETEAKINPQGLDAAFWTWFSDAASLFPCGIDVFLTSGSNVIGLPRSVKVEV